jgi:hypothetical protein
MMTQMWTKDTQVPACGTWVLRGEDWKQAYLHKYEMKGELIKQTKAGEYWIQSWRKEGLCTETTEISLQAEGTIHTVFFQGLWTTGRRRGECGWECVGMGEGFEPSKYYSWETSESNKEEWWGVPLAAEWQTEGKGPRGWQRGQEGISCIHRVREPGGLDQQGGRDSGVRCPAPYKAKVLLRECMSVWYD